MSNLTIVMYHGGGCADGFTAAWAASGELGRGPDVKYVPMQYGDPLPKEIGEGQADRVYLLDFSLPRDAMQFVATMAREVVCLDHHRTAQQALDGLDGSAPGLRVIFDMEKSGAMLAWEYFHPEKPVPDLIKLVQDRDLWRWELPDSREISAALFVEPKDFARWDEFWEDLDFEAPRETIISRGSAILAAQKMYVETLVGHARYTVVGGHAVPTVNTPLFQSETGEALCLAHPDAPFAATFFVRIADEPFAAEQTVYSLRSRNGFDVSEVARSMGGGGHKAAAGFVVKVDGRRGVAKS